MAEILELPATRPQTRRPASPRYTCNNEEFNKLLAVVTIAQGAVLLKIQTGLLSKEGSGAASPKSSKADNHRSETERLFSGPLSVWKDERQLWECICHTPFSL
ncbi:histone H2AX-like [Narcine bancroftii]|uniref:histone H2AX-like n=1 Tax=Narcine bancroftii TaxID=1343680 RepID=UPI003831A8F6